MAGPCSVESRDQIERSAEIVARLGAQVIRAGAFKTAAARPTPFRASRGRLAHVARGRRPHGLLVVSGG